MASADRNLLGFGSTGRVDKLDVNGSIVARKTFNDQQCYTRESKILKELQRFPHKNIVQLLGFGSNYLDLEFVSSGTLWDWMRIQDRYTSFTGEDVQSMLISWLEALEHFHRVIRRAHFDDKPTKILLTEADTEVLRFLKLEQSGQCHHPAGHVRVHAGGALPC